MNNTQRAGFVPFQRWLIILAFIFTYPGTGTVVLHAQTDIRHQKSGNQLKEDYDKREAFLRQILPILPPDRTDRGHPSPLDDTWQDWQKRTGELPPNFDAMPSIPFLPDPMMLEKDGVEIPVETQEQWLEKRQWIEREIQHWITGTFPPPPDNLFGAGQHGRSLAPGPHAYGRFIPVVDEVSQLPA